MKTAPISVCGYGWIGTKFSTSSFVFGKNQFKLVVLLSSSCSKSCKSIGKSKHSFDRNKAKFSVIFVSLVYRKLGKSSRIWSIHATAVTSAHKDMKQTSNYPRPVLIFGIFSLFCLTEFLPPFSGQF